MKKKITKKLGKLGGKVLVFGGVYSNYQSLLKMKEIAEELAIPSSNIICTGDMVGYCSQPEESVQFIKSWGIQSIIGNVEEQLREGKDNCGCDFDMGSRCDIFSARWYPYAKSILSDDSIKWMKYLPDFIQFEYGGKKCFVVHGSFFHISEYVFESTPWHLKKRNFNATGSDVIFAGHSGLPFHHQKGQHLWLNPGVIGMPANDATTRVWYMLLDTDKRGELAFKHASYTYENRDAAILMRKRNLPQEYALTLETGVWDNCEILPDWETQKQGVEIDL